jgi:hypothetical protein
MKWEIENDFRLSQAAIFNGKEEKNKKEFFNVFW